jgi:nicotinamidase/pyrazinamidase
MWPVHCVQGSPGAAFAESLRLPVDTVIVRKGLNPRIDSYSGFFDNGHRQATELETVLRERGAERLVIAGLATDYCVKFTALDAVELGFETALVLDACRGVELNEGDIDRALTEMRRAGVRLITSEQALVADDC